MAAKNIEETTLLVIIERLEELLVDIRGAVGDPVCEEPIEGCLHCIIRRKDPSWSIAIPTREAGNRPLQ